VTIPPSPGDDILAKPLDEIEVMIGEALLGDEFGAKESSEAEKPRVARRWPDNLAALREHAYDSGPAKRP